MSPARIFWGLTLPFFVLVMAYEASRLWLLHTSSPSGLPIFLQRAMLWMVPAGLWWILWLSFALLLLAPLLIIGVVVLVARGPGSPEGTMRLRWQALVLLMVSLTAWVVVALTSPRIIEENPLALIYLAPWVAVSSQVAAVSAAFLLQRDLRKANRSRVPPWLLVVVGVALQLVSTAYASLVVLMPIVADWQAGYRDAGTANTDTN